MPDTLQAFREAGVRVWLLTGDKFETALNIGFSARLLTSNMALCLLVDPAGPDAAYVRTQHARTLFPHPFPALPNATPLHPPLPSMNTPAFLSFYFLSFSIMYIQLCT